MSKQAESYLQLRGTSPLLQPKINLEGHLYETLWPHVFVSGAAGITEYCTYEKGLTAKLWVENEEIPEESPETSKMLEGGNRGH